jgi:hypothetical protein
MKKIRIGGKKRKRVRKRICNVILTQVNELYL